jgi:heat shock protein HslJ
MAQADAFRSALESARRFRIVDGRLELLSSDGATLAVMAAQSNSLVGVWEVIAVNNGRQAVVGVLDEAPLDMTFGKDGTVTGSAGCNRFTAGFTAAGTAFRFGPAATTRRICPGDGVMEQEQAFLNALASVTTMRVEGDRLEFRTADDALALMLRRVPSSR